MNNTTSNSIEVTIKQEWDDDGKDSQHILPAPEFVSVKDKHSMPEYTAQRTPSAAAQQLDTSSVKLEADDNCIVYNANDYEDLDDQEFVDEDGSDNIIVYELENEREEWVEEGKEKIQMDVEEEKPQLTVATPTICTKRNVSNAPAAPPLPVMPMQKQKSGIITIKATKPTTVPVVNSLVSLGPQVTQLRNYSTTNKVKSIRLRPCISSRMYRIPGQRLGINAVPAALPVPVSSPIKLPTKLPTKPSTKLPAKLPTKLYSDLIESTKPLPKVDPIELKLKCMCRLYKPKTAATSLAANLQVKYFFEKWFHETCKLSPRSQRIVQNTLLSAVCQAEEDVEAGKYCEKCYAYK